MSTDSPLKWVRQHVFRATQEELAEIGGVSRTRVTRYESAGEAPPYEFLRRLLEAAADRNLPLQAEWFFRVPDQRTGDPTVMAAARCE